MFHRNQFRRSILFSLAMLLGVTFNVVLGQKDLHISSVNFDQLENRFRSGGDTLYLVNFWATWCKPCVAELPYLEEFHKKYADEKVKVLLVSLDFPRMVDTKLIPFLEKHGLKSEVVHLNDTRANEWIDRVNTEWSGAIPATVARKGNVEIFHEGSFPDIRSLEDFVNQLP